MILYPINKDLPELARQYNKFFLVKTNENQNYINKILSPLPILQ